ncbi:F-box protein [Hibiscus syriacus]|uniref:F-box protein n=1 Tax=Hibiscus syriacus TaxID=106335 RepID=A0A6A2XPS8_HIBSY|nr:F-box protein [Hibiscus syriacus]
MARIMRLAWQYVSNGDTARDDYIWKCVCAKRWPSVCKRPSPPTATYYKLYRTFYKRKHQRTLLPQRLSFNDLDFFTDIWTEDKLIFSEVVRGPVLRNGFKIPHIEYKLTLPVEPRFDLPWSQTTSVSVLVERTDSNKVARIVNKSLFDYIDRTASRALAFDQCF